MNKNPQYDDQYYLTNHLKSMDSVYGHLVKKYYHYIASYILAGAAKIKNKAKVLDIGCGVGTLVEQFNKLGFDAYGVDVSKCAIKNSIYPQKCSLVKTTAKLKFPKQHFDLIVSREVLEHIPKKEISNCIKEWDRISKGKMVHIIAVTERGPSATDDPAHINVQSESWWIKTFKKHHYRAIKNPQPFFISPFGSSGYFMFDKT